MAEKLGSEGSVACPGKLSDVSACLGLDDARRAPRCEVLSSDAADESGTTASVSVSGPRSPRVGFGPGPLVSFLTLLQATHLPFACTR